MHPNAYAGCPVTITPARVGFVVRPVPGHDGDAELATSLAELLSLVEEWFDGDHDGAMEPPFDLDDGGEGVGPDEEEFGFG